MVLVEPTKTGRWKWHGVLICTEHALQRAIIEEFAPLAPHDVLRKWLYIDSRHDEFEATMVLEERAALFEGESKNLGEPFHVSSPPEDLVANLLARLAGAKCAHAFLPL